jgi:hypothetical protein
MLVSDIRFFLFAAAAPPSFSLGVIRFIVVLVFLVSIADFDSLLNDRFG